jgi:hypothetical protein
MFKYFQIVLILIASCFSATAQRVLTENDAIQLALKNARNINVSSLTLRQQQQLLRGAAGLAAPQLTLEKSPYEPQAFSSSSIGPAYTVSGSNYSRQE